MHDAFRKFPVPGPVLRIVVGMLAGGLLLAMLLVWDYGFSSMPVSNGGGPETVYIPPGKGLKEIQQILVDAGMIRDDIRFLLLARLMGSEALPST